MNLNFAASILATMVFGASAETAPANNLRGQRQRKLDVFADGLGQCSGAVCGLWGDPHMITCDGLHYDCQGIGIYTLMENHMFNIQANFVDVGAREHVYIAEWGMTSGASLTNDIVIQYKQDETVPVLQFGFGDLSGYDIPSEEGCHPWTTFDPVDMGESLDGERTHADNLQACRARCDANPHCTQFSYWADGGCHLNNDDAVMIPSNRNWSRALAGTTDSACGVSNPDLDITLQGSDGEENKHGEINQSCPLLMYVDGQLQDLSQITPGPSDGVVSLLGSPGDNVYVELVQNDQIHIIYKTDNDDYSEMELRRSGDGPGELWSCHWNYYLCLPASQKDQFQDTTVGLLGTPNGDTSDDWMTRDGTQLQLQHTGDQRHENMYDYCVENWCVSQEDSIMTYHGDTTYADHKCEAEDHIDWTVDNEFCALDADTIFLACKDEPLHLRYACELDCCFGGCSTIQETINDIIVNDEKVPEVVFEYNGDEVCVKDDLENTSSTVCPNADIIKLLETKGDQTLPDDDVFYDIAFGDDSVSFKINNPFGASANVFVKHDREALGDFLAPACEGGELRPVECNNDFSVTAKCLDYADVDSFALVTVYFASVAVSPLNEQAVIDRCCEPEVYAPAVGIAEYTFEVPCGCPGATSR